MCRRFPGGGNVCYVGGFMSSRRFRLNINNMPMINLRTEFESFFKLVSDPGFRGFIKQHPREIDINLFVWRGQVGDLLTILLQRSIFGLESYIPGCLKVTHIRLLGPPSKRFSTLVDNPYAAKSDTMRAYYDEAPGMIAEAMRLKNYSRELCSANAEFYRNIRNPLSHGGGIFGADIDGVLSVMQHIDRLFRWADSWQNPDDFTEGFSEVIEAIRSPDRGVSAVQQTITIPIKL